MLGSLRKNRLFPWPEELFNLFFPIFLLPFVAATAVFGYEWAGGYYFYLAFFSNILLLNIGHTALSFYVLQFPEGREFLRRSSWKEIGGILLCGAGGMAIFVATGSLENLAGVRSSGMSTGTLAIFLLKIFSTWHLIFQVRGILLVYERGAFGSDEKKKRKNENLERKMFLAIFFFVFLGAALPFFHLADHEFFLETLRGKIQILLILLAAIAVSVIAWSSGRGETTNWNKVVFSLRLFILPFYVVSPVAVFAGQAVHGMESIFFFRRIHAKASADQNSHFHRWAWVIGVSVVSLMGLPVIVRASSFSGAVFFAEIMGAQAAGIFTNAVIAVSLTTSLLHFYIDSRIYRMRNPVVRNTLGKLLA